MKKLKILKMTSLSNKILAQIRLAEEFQYSLNIMTKAQLDEVAEWCKKTGCGKRARGWHDMFEFDKEEQLTMFVLKWS